MEFIYEWNFSISILHILITYVIYIYKEIPTGHFTKSEKMQMQTFPGCN